MKLKIDDKVYLQKYEVAHIMHDLDSIPATVVDEITRGRSRRFFSMNDPTDAYRFGFAFKNPASVKWLMEQGWIVNYDEYFEMPLPELEALVERLKAEHGAGIDEFNAKDEAYREKHLEKVSNKFHKDSHKISSLDDLISARKGKVTFVFPDGYQGKTTPGASGATSTPKKKLGFFARLSQEEARLLRTALWPRRPVMGAFLLLENPRLGRWMFIILFVYIARLHFLGIILAVVRLIR